MPPFPRREFSGNAVPTTISGTIGAGDLTINIVASTGWPTGGTGPFIVTIDQGLATEEKVEVLSRTGLALTITPTGRGHDNTAAVGHGGGAKIEHTLAARDLSEANQHLADVTLDNHTQYLNPTRHTATQHVINTADIVDGAVTTAKVLDGAITYAKHAAGQRHEPGDFKWGIQTANHTGWLLCDGSVVSIAAQGALWAAMGSAHLFGTDPGSASFRLPDLRKKVIMGKAASGVGSTLGGSGGTADAVVVSHSHIVDSHNHFTNTVAETTEHTHTLSNHTHSTADGGSAAHSLSGVSGGDIAVRVSSVEGLNLSPSATRISFTYLLDHPNHNHGGTGGSNVASAGRSATHTHGIPSDSPGTNLIGTSGTDLNLPPFMAVNGFIHI